MIVTLFINVHDFFSLSSRVTTFLKKNAYSLICIFRIAYIIVRGGIGSEYPSIVLVFLVYISGFLVLMCLVIYFMKLLGMQRGHGCC